MAREDHRIRVLIADDHTIIRDGLRAILDSRDDIEVVGQAATGRAAVEAVETLRPDVAILDIGMPELNGIEATVRLARSAPECQVIILTMYSTSEHIYRALKAGARGYLLKNSAGVEVVEAVHKVYRGHRFLSEQVSDLVVGDYLDSREANPGPIGSLSEREREVLQLIVEGKPPGKIAELLDISPKTVETYRARLMKKLKVSDLPALIRFAIRHGITPLD